MKKLIATAALIGSMAVTTAFTGCQTDITWTPELVYQTTYCVGITAGAVIESRNFETNVTDNILGILDTVKSAVPAKGMTFTETWTPLIEEYLASKTDISEETKGLIKVGCGIITSAIDMKASTYPEIISTTEYVRSAIDGLVAGVKYYVKPSNQQDTNTVKSVKALKSAPAIDYELYKALDQKLRQ